MLSRAIYQFKQTEELAGNVIYDRGIPDMLAYFQLFNLNYPPAEIAAKLFQYEPKVFIFPAWKEIYTTDDERKMSFELAADFGAKIQKIYSEYGYELISVPCIPAKDRVQFLLDQII